MTPIQEYCEQSGISRQWAHKLISKREIKSVKLHGKTYIITETDNTEAGHTGAKFNQNHIAAFIRSCKTQAAEKGIEILPQVLRRIEKFERSTGLKLKGVSYKSLWAIARSRRTAERKPRKDKFIPRNKFLQNEEIYNEAIRLIFGFYGQDSLHSLNLAVHLAIEYAKQNELYEIAAVPKDTLYAQAVKYRDAFGMGVIHQFSNHYNMFRNTLPRAIGSFTEDTPYGTWYIDDHKLDISGVKDFNPHTGKLDTKKLESWFVIEGRTFDPKGYDIKAGSFCENDIVLMLMKAFLEHGTPQRIVCDNGLAAGERVSSFLQKMGIELVVAPPYDPTFKAVVERFFKFIKEETDCFQEDFVGSAHHTEGRHRSSVLSPEESLELESVAIKRYEDYLTGFFLDRPRRLPRPDVPQDYYKNSMISIRALEEYYYKQCAYTPADPRQLRYAYTLEAHSKKFNNTLKFKGETYMPESYTAVSLALLNRTYRICYNPLDLSSVDLYTEHDLHDKHNDKIYHRGMYVMTLRCIRTLADKRSAVARYKKGITKQVRKLATELTPDMPVLITPQGDAINIRRRVQQDIEKVLTESVSRIPVAEFAAQTVHATEEVTDVQVKEYFDKHIKPEEEFNPDTYDWNSINDIKI